jgi:hypothetical protein
MTNSEENTPLIYGPETAADQPASSDKAVGTASCLGIFLGTVLGLLIGIVLVAGMWLLLLGMLVAAPPLEFLARIEESMIGMLWLSVILVVGLPLLGAVFGGVASASMAALWRKIKQRRSSRKPQETPPAVAALPADVEVTAPPEMPDEPAAPAAPPSRASLIARSVGVWLGLFGVGLIVAMLALAAVVRLQPEGNAGWLTFLVLLLACHLLATFLAFRSLLPGGGLRGWWQGPMAGGEMALLPIIPALFFGAAVCLLLWLAAVLLSSLLLASPNLSGGVMLAGLFLAPALGAALAWSTYRRHAAGA